MRLVKGRFRWLAGFVGASLGEFIKQVGEIYSDVGLHNYKPARDTFLVIEEEV